MANNFFSAGVLSASAEMWFLKKNKVWKNVTLCFIQAGIICHMYCYYLFSWTEQQFVFIWSLWLFTLLVQKPFCFCSSSALSCVNGLSTSVDIMVCPVFVLVLTGSKRQDDTRERRNTFSFWLVERKVLNVSLIFKNIARWKEYYTFWVINSLLIIEYISSEDQKIPLKPN